jgi:hypothetical protein
MSRVSGLEISCIERGLVCPASQTGVFIGVITQKTASCCDNPRKPVLVFGIQVSLHQNGDTPLWQADSSESITRPERRDVDGQDSQRSAAQNDMYPS